MFHKHKIFQHCQTFIEWRCKVSAFIWNMQEKGVGKRLLEISRLWMRAWGNAKSVSALRGFRGKIGGERKKNSCPKSVRAGEGEMGLLTVAEDNKPPA